MRLFSLLVISFALALLSACKQAEQPEAESAPEVADTESPESVQQVIDEVVDAEDVIDYCINPPNDELCSKIPHDVTEQVGAGYSQLSVTVQRPFDNFSWQSFVALNWPADGNGNPLSDSIGSKPDAPRVWMSYEGPADVFAPDFQAQDDALDDICQVDDSNNLPMFYLMSKSGHLLETSSFLESVVDQPLVDRNLNFAVFDIRMNPVEVDYIEKYSLNTISGQQAFKDNGTAVSFPLGHYDDNATNTGGQVGAMELKTAWRVIPSGSGEDTSKFYTTDGMVFVAANNSDSGKAFCFQAQLALVGFHIMQRVTGPYQQFMPSEPAFDQDWMWSTFEHVDNAPMATNAQDPTDNSPGPKVCEQPADAGDHYSFFNPECSGSGCPTNDPPALQSGQKYYTWATEPPYAARYAVDGKFGTQVVRCREIYSGTEALNVLYQAKLKGTVWENYRLVNTQWKGGIEDPVTENGDIPRHLVNTTMETYLQADGSCLDCHGFAETAIKGQDANFSFLLRLAGQLDVLAGSN